LCCVVLFGFGFIVLHQKPLPACIFNVSEKESLEKIDDEDEEDHDQDHDNDYHEYDEQNDDDDDGRQFA
jgi:hypothetical protein